MSARLSKGARQQQALLEQYNYIINGPPDQPAFDAAADAASAVQQLLTADVILTTFDVLQQVRQEHGVWGAGIGWTAVIENIISSSHCCGRSAY